jgi:hypothetical protein
MITKIILMLLAKIFGISVEIELKIMDIEVLIGKESQYILISKMLLTSKHILKLSEIPPP